MGVFHAALLCLLPVTERHGMCAVLSAPSGGMHTRYIH
jgi:hypothetical protein